MWALPDVRKTESLLKSACNDVLAGENKKSSHVLLFLFSVERKIATIFVTKSDQLFTIVLYNDKRAKQKRDYPHQQAVNKFRSDANSFTLQSG